MWRDWLGRLESVITEPASPVPLSAVDLAQLKQSVAALLLEMVYADFVVLPVERKAVAESLSRYFDLDAEELDKLVGNAKDQVQSAPGWLVHVASVNELMTREQKLHLLHCLWQLAQVDSVVHVMENAMFEQLAQALRINPGELARIRRETNV